MRHDSTSPPSGEIHSTVVFPEWTPDHTLAMLAFTVNVIDRINVNGTDVRDYRKDKPWLSRMFTRMFRKSRKS